jgi:metallo-beta-lactamase family protein
LSGTSAHADADELLAWMGAIPVPPKRVFITHGEPAAADALRQRIERQLGWEVTVPDFRDTVDLHAIRDGLRAQT